MVNKAKEREEMTNSQLKIYNKLLEKTIIQALSVELSTSLTMRDIAHNLYMAVMDDIKNAIKREFDYINKEL